MINQKSDSVFIDDEAKREDFIRTFAHDMKNPLTAVIGSIDIIREGLLGPINDEQEEYLQSAIDSCHEVVMMIDNLLDIKKFETGKISMALHPYNAHEFISKATTRFSRQAKHDGIEFSVDLEQDTSEIAIDSNVFARVLANLLGTALKFSPEEGKIIVSYRSISEEDLQGQTIPVYAPTPPDFFKPGRFVKIIVSDIGNGLQSDECEFMFDSHAPFTQKTGRQQGATGLGLAYCKKAIESFHGMIWAEPGDNQANNVTIILPCC